MRSHVSVFLVFLAGCAPPSGRAFVGRASLDSVVVVAAPVESGTVLFGVETGVVVLDETEVRGQRLAELARVVVHARASRTGDALHLATYELGTDSIARRPFRPGDRTLDGVAAQVVDLELEPLHRFDVVVRARGLPAAGALVQVATSGCLGPHLSAEGVTDALGRMSVLAERRILSAAVRHPGFAARRRHLEAGETVFDLDPGFEVEGIVFDSSGHPVVETPV